MMGFELMKEEIGVESDKKLKLISDENKGNEIFLKAVSGVVKIMSDNIRLISKVCFYL